MYSTNNKISLLKTKKKKIHLEELGFEPRTFSMRSRHSTTELHPRLCIKYFT